MPRFVHTLKQNKLIRLASPKHAENPLLYHTEGPRSSPRPREQSDSKKGTCKSATMSEMVLIFSLAELTR